MTDEERLKAINNILDSDECFHNTNLYPDGALAQIYRIVHPRFSSCEHKDWEENNNKLV